MQFDIVIIGGGIVGSSIAYFLAKSGRAGSIAVIEPDSSYRLAATSAGAGGVRQLFSQPENIQMSRYSLQFYKEFAQSMALDGQPANVDFSECGYLFVVGESGAKQLEANYKRQSSLGVDALLLDKADLATRFPSLGLDDIVLGCLSPTDGTLSTSLALAGFRGQAERMGVTYVDGRVTALAGDDTILRSATLESDVTISADVFINAAGAWAGEVAALAGMPMPVVPMCRVKHFWEAPTALEPLPLVKDESGVFFRQQGNGFTGGRPSFEIEPGFYFGENKESLARYFGDYFVRVVRPLLATRLPAFGAATCTNSWTAHYAQNTFDGNMFLGPWVGGATNFYAACGFSGHGVMHAPAVGMALSELVLDGEFTTMDLSKMSYQRLVDDEPYAEQGII